MRNRTVEQPNATSDCYLYEQMLAHPPTKFETVTTSGLDIPLFAATGIPIFTRRRRMIETVDKQALQQAKQACEESKKNVDEFSVAKPGNKR